MDNPVVFLYDEAHFVLSAFGQIVNID